MGGHIGFSQSLANSDEALKAAVTVSLQYFDQAHDDQLSLVKNSCVLKRSNQLFYVRISYFHKWLSSLALQQSFKVTLA